MAIKQETVKLSISDDCNGHDYDVDGYDYENDKNVKNTMMMIITMITIITILDNDDDDDDVDDDDDDDKVISKLNKSKPNSQLLMSCKRG